MVMVFQNNQMTATSVSGRSTFFYNYTTNLPYNKVYNNCDNTLCYTYSKNFIYKPHADLGRVGTTASSYLFRRKRI
jgi:hypothetical protein